MEFFERDDLDRLIACDAMLSAAINKLCDAFNDANLAVHDYVLNHGGKPLPRPYFLLVQDRRQLRHLTNFLK
jgi:hypothetical protein